jgi:D-amino peptidase
MKIYISADIEGVTGVTHWDETELSHAEHTAAREQMTNEVVAACEGALQAGATEILVKDSHDTARNLIATRLPQEARLIRGWSGHPFQTLTQLDKTFKAVLLIGYHSGAGFGKSPLEHTWSGNLMCVKLNGQYISEFSLDALTGTYIGAPVVFVSGDQGLCTHVAETNPNIQTVAVKEGIGEATVNIHPDLAVRYIRTGVSQALQGNFERYFIPIPKLFTLEMRYRKHSRAYQMGFFPGARQVDTFTVQFETDDYFDLLRFFMFAI